jgi:hypothetical protein
MQNIQRKYTMALAEMNKMMWIVGAMISNFRPRGTMTAIKNDSGNVCSSESKRTKANTSELTSVFLDPYFACLIVRGR